MADRTNKGFENVDGPFYVDDSCIQCGNCVEVAPDHFIEDCDGSYVYDQPTNDDEIENCQQAMEECPMDAIGNDGEEE